MADGLSWFEQGGIRCLRLQGLEAGGGVVALCTTRHGGVSPAPWQALNFSYTVGDDPRRVLENRRRALAQAGVPLHRTVVAGLVHGDRVVPVGQPCPGTGPGAPVADPAGLVSGCDGLVSATPELALAVTTADCVPVFLYDPVTPAIGLAHAGWRGTAAGIAARAVAVMAATYGTAPANLRAAVGPAIGPCCYEVGEPVRRAFSQAAASGWFRPAAKGKYYLDLWSANRDQLVAAGVVRHRVAVAQLCTACSPGEFFSHRGEGGQTGRMAAILALRPRGVAT